jgi:hypothetical protein
MFMKKAPGMSAMRKLTGNKFLVQGYSDKLKSFLSKNSSDLLSNFSVLLFLLLQAHGTLSESGLKTEPGIVPHVCNPSYSKGRNQEDGSLRPPPGKKLERPYLNEKAGCGGACLSSQLYRMLK